MISSISLNLMNHAVLRQTSQMSALFLSVRPLTKYSMNLNHWSSSSFVYLNRLLGN